MPQPSASSSVLPYTDEPLHGSHPASDQYPHLSIYGVHAPGTYLVSIRSIFEKPFDPPSTVIVALFSHSLSFLLLITFFETLSFFFPDYALLYALSFVVLSLVQEFVFVLDVSSTLSSENFELVKKWMLFTISTLRNEDKVQIYL